MWSKAKSTGSLLVQNVESVLGVSDYSADNIWKRRFERRIQAGELGISLSTVLPEKMIPLSWQRQVIVKQVEDTLSCMSVKEDQRSSDDLLKCSTIGLLDPSSMHVVAESLQTPRASNLFGNIEDFVTSEQLLAGNQVFLKELDLTTEWSELDLDELPTPVSSEDTFEDKLGFISTDDLKTELEKWKGTQQPFGDEDKKECVMSPATDVLQTDHTDFENWEGEQESTKKEKPAGKTESQCSCKHTVSDSSVDVSNVDGSSSGGYSADVNNSGKENAVTPFVSKINPTVANCNNHAGLDAKKNSKQRTFVGVANMAYQQSTASVYQQSDVTGDSVPEIRPVKPTTADSQVTDKVNLQLKKETTLLKGRDGYKHYKLFAMVEKAVNIKRMEKLKTDLVEEYRWKKSVVDELVDVARAYYLNPTGPNRKKWKRLRQGIDQHSRHSMTDTRVKLASVTSFIPVFTYIIIVLQIVMLGILVALGGEATIDVASRRILQGNTKTFLGSETVDTWQEVNMWIGPESSFLIDMGGILGLCMRDDFNLYMIGVTKNYSASSTLGCCEISVRNTAGTTTLEECHALSLGIGQWRNVTCVQRQPGDNSVEHVMKPCCVDNRGSCLLLSQEHCTFLGGIPSEKHQEHCSQVNCPSKICKMGGISSDPSKPWLPASYQWWRPLVSLVYSHGIIHLLLVVMGEWLLLRQVEMTAGWLRVAIIYVLCGLTGGVCASLFSPYTPQVGITAAVMGSLGVVHMELIEGWKLLNKPWLELIKIYSLLLFAIFTGTLPQISNAAIITGFVTGLLSAVAFLPYIQLRLWNRRLQMAAVAVSLLLLLFLLFFVIYCFHKIQSLHLCEWCKKFECVDYTANMCTSGGQTPSSDSS